MRLIYFSFEAQLLICLSHSAILFLHSFFQVISKDAHIFSKCSQSYLLFLFLAVPSSLHFLTSHPSPILTFSRLCPSFKHGYFSMGQWSSIHRHEAARCNAQSSKRICFEQASAIQGLFERERFQRHPSHPPWFSKRIHLESL